MSMSKYPEHEKLRAVQDKSQLLGYFLEWLESDGRRIAVAHEHTRDCDPPRKGRDDIGRECGMLAADALTYALPPYYTWEPPGSGPRIERILAMYLGIDMDKIRAEKEEIFREVQRDVDAKRVRL